MINFKKPEECGISSASIERFVRTLEDRKLYTHNLIIAKGNDIPYIQLTREIRNAYPAVTEVHISQGASVTSDSLKLSPCLSVIISCSEALSPEDANRLNEWLKIRMETEDIILVQKQ